MKMRRMLAGAAMVSCFGALAMADDHEAETPADMAGMMAMGAPNANHERLNYFIGDWRAVMKFRMSQEMTAQPGEFDSTYESVMDGRFVEERVTSESPMGVFEGRGVLGYDNTKQRYVAIWFDNMSTTIHQSEGFVDEEAHTMEFNGVSPGMDGEWKTTRSILEIHGEDTFTMREWVYEDDGTRWQRFEAEYTRQED